MFERLSLSFKVLRRKKN